MKKRMEKAFAFVDAHRDEMLALWEELVNTESGSSNKEGVDTVANRIKGILSR
jgi:glutamate carboxypeptidase